MTGKDTSKPRVLGCKAVEGERESTHLFLLSTFFGIRINRGFAFNVGRTFHKNLRSSVLSLGVKNPWPNVM